MSLETQLHREADKLFDRAYDKLFENFSRDFEALTGVSPSSRDISDDELDEFRRIYALRFTTTSLLNDVSRKAARTAAREKYVTDFLASQKLSVSQRFWRFVESIVRRG